jgi:hypothetical protein
LTHSRKCAKVTAGWHPFQLTQDGVCRGCGRTEDVDCVVGARPCLEPVDDPGFALDEAEVVFWGLCPGCIAADRAADDAHEYKETVQ